MGSLEVGSVETGRKVCDRQRPQERKRRSQSAGSVARLTESDIRQSAGVGSEGSRRAPRIIVTTRTPAAMIHLDTGFLIRALVRDSSEDIKLRTWLRSNTPVGMSSIAWSEFLCIPAAKNDIDLAVRILLDRQPFTDEDAALAARLFNFSGRRRGTFVDCMIAAVALGVGASLATTNPDDFRRLEPAGLQIITV